MNPRSLCCIVPGSSGGDVGDLALFILPLGLRFPQTQCLSQFLKCIPPLFWPFLETLPPPARLLSVIVALAVWNR